MVKKENLPAANSGGSNHASETLSEWMTAAEAAAYLRTKPRTLLKWVREGSIKAWLLYGTTRPTWRFRKEDLDAALGFIGTRTAHGTLLPSMVALSHFAQVGGQPNQGFAVAPNRDVAGITCVVT